MAEKEKPSIIATTLGMPLALQVAKELGVPVAKTRYENGNVLGAARVILESSVRGQNAFIIAPCPTMADQNEAVHTCRVVRSAHARSVTLIMPYLDCGREPSKDGDYRVSNGVAITCDELKVSHADRYVMYDLHDRNAILAAMGDRASERHVSSFLVPELASLARGKEFAVVAAAEKAIPRARYYAKKLGPNRETPVIFDEDGTIEIPNKKRLKGKLTFVIDDMSATGVTMARAAETLKACGADPIIGAICHGAFSDDAAERIGQSALTTLFVPDTLPQDTNRLAAARGKIKVLGCSKITAEVIRGMNFGHTLSQYA